jgi:hypothetical protein
MSSTKKLVIIFTCIFAAAIIGVGVILGIFFGNGRNISNFGEIFGAGDLNLSENSTLDLSGVTALRVDCASAEIRFVESDESHVTLEGLVISPIQQKPRLNVS